MGHEVLPAIFHNMQRPSRYASVVYIAFTAMICSYALIATFGYIVFGNRARGNIMENLPAGDGVTTAVQVCIALTALTKLCLSAAPLTEGLLEWVQLVVYMISHSSMLSSLTRLAARPMPRLRMDPTTQSIVPATASVASAASALAAATAAMATKGSSGTYGTYTTIGTSPGTDLNTTTVTTTSAPLTAGTGVTTLATATPSTAPAATPSRRTIPAYKPSSSDATSPYQYITYRGGFRTPSPSHNKQHDRAADAAAAMAAMQRTGIPRFSPVSALKKNISPSSGTAATSTSRSTPSAAQERQPLLGSKSKSKIVSGKHSEQNNDHVQEQRSGEKSGIAVVPTPPPPATGARAELQVLPVQAHGVSSDIPFPQVPSELRPPPLRLQPPSPEPPESPPPPPHASSGGRSQHQQYQKYVLPFPLPRGRQSRSMSLVTNTSGASSATPRRELTWSDTLPIPPIRSTSCESMILGESGGSSSINSTNDRLAAAAVQLAALKSSGGGGGGGGGVSASCTATTAPTAAGSE